MQPLHIIIRFDNQGGCFVAITPNRQADTEKYGELLLFAHYALRVITLTQIEESKHALDGFLNPYAAQMQPRQVESFLSQEGLFLSKTEMKRGRGYNLDLTFQGGAYGQLHIQPRGFGVHPKDARLYAPTAVVVLFCYLLQHHARDDHFVKSLQAIAEYCGQAGTNNMTSTKLENEAAFALAARAYPHIFARISAA